MTIRTVQRGYHDGGRQPAGQVRRVHVIREEGPRGWESGTRRTWCGQTSGRVTHSPPVIREAPHELPEGMTWCPKCVGLLAELAGRLDEVARWRPLSFGQVRPTSRPVFGSLQ